MTPTLTATRWQPPADYAGFQPTGDYVILARHRDCDLMTESNFQTAARQLQAAYLNDPDTDPRPPAYTWRAGCSLTGWVEYLMVTPDAPADTLQAADGILAAIAAYPCLDEDDYVTRQYEAADAYWLTLTPDEQSATSITELTELFP